MKRTLLTLIAALLLGGAAIAQNHWDAPDSHAKSSNTPIVASVTINDQPVTLTADYRLGAFVGDELRGLAAPYTEEEGNFEDSNFWIQVFYNQGTNETISFKLYDGSQEYTTCSVTKATQEAGWGTPTNPVVLDFATTQTMTQTTELVSGWNWWSTPVEMSNINGLQILENSLGASAQFIKSRTQYVEPLDLGGFVEWIGDLESITNEQMYMIQTNATCSTILSGPVATPSDHPITINYGWNWIGYPSNQSMNFESGLGEFSPSDEDMIKSRSGYSEYSELFGMWLGDPIVFEPGSGYMYYSTSNSPKTLVYQTSRGEAPIVLSKESFFTPNTDNYAHNMTITAVIDLEGRELREDGYEVAAFVGDECRGSARIQYVEPLDRYMAFLLVFGDNNENLRFVLTDGNNNSWSNDYMMYSINGVVGSLSSPTTLHFGTLGMDEDGESMIVVYPNPSNGIFNIFGNNIRKIEIINTYGQVIYSKEVKEESIQVNLSNYAVGAYLLRVVSNNSITTKQLIKQ